MSLVNTTSEWKNLEQHALANRGIHLRELFTNDPKRFETFSRRELNLLFDFSRQRVTSETISLLIALANASGLRARIDAMFSGCEDQHDRKSCGVAHSTTKSFG